MAFKKNINDLSGILVLVLLYLPAISANIDCNGKPFHCVNTTHFMICVDLGSGVSSTIDDFIIPCPPTTVCLRTNRFECEFPAVTTTTTTIDAPATLVTKTVYSETVWTETTSAVNDVTTSIPFEEYFNTISSTTLSDVTVSTQPTIETEPSGAVSDFTENINVISTLNDVLPFETVNVVQNDSTKLYDRNSTVLPNNIVSESIMNMTGSLNVAFPNLKSYSTFNQTISDDVQNTLTLEIINNTQNSTLPYNIDLNIMSDFNSTLSEASTSDSGDTVKYEMTTPAIPRSTDYLVKSESALTDVTQSLSVNKQESEYDSTSRYEQHSRILSKIDYDAITNATETSRLELNPVLNEATSSVLVDAVQYEPTTLVIPSSTDLPIDIGTDPIVMDGTGNLSWMKHESSSSKTIPIVSYDVQNDTNVYTRNRTSSILTGTTGNLSEVEHISENKSSSSQTISIVSYDVYNATNEYKQNSNLTNRINNITVSNATEINATQLDIYPISNEAIPSDPVDAVPYEPVLLVTSSSIDLQINIGTDLVLTDVTGNLSDIKQDSENKSSLSQTISIVSYDMYNDTNVYEKNRNLPHKNNNVTVSNSTETNVTKFDIYPISNEAISSVPVDVVQYEPTILVTPSSMDLPTNVRSGSILGNLSDIKQDSENQSSSSNTISSVSHHVYNDTLYVVQNSNLSNKTNNNPVSNSTETNVTKFDINPISNEAISSAPVSYQATMLVTPSSIDLPINIGPGPILTGNSSEIKNLSENKSFSNQKIATVSYDVYNDTNLYKQNSNLSNEINRTVSNSTDTDVTQSDIYPISKADISTVTVDTVPYESTIIFTPSGIDLQNNIGTGSKLSDATGNLSKIKQDSQNQSSSSQTISNVSYDVYNGTNGYEQKSNLPDKINNNTVSNSTEANVTKLDIYPILNEAISSAPVETVPYESTIIVTPRGIDLQNNIGTGSKLADATGNLSEIKQGSQNQSSSSQTISNVSYDVYNGTNGYEQNSNLLDKINNNTVSNSTEANVTKLDIYPILNEAISSAPVEAVPYESTILVTPSSIDLPINIGPDSILTGDLSEMKHPPENKSFSNQTISIVSYGVYNDTNLYKQNSSMDKLDKNTVTNSFETNENQFEFDSNMNEAISSMSLDAVQYEPTRLVQPSGIDYSNNIVTLLNNGTRDINVIEKVPQFNTDLTTTVVADDAAKTPYLPNSLDIPLNLVNESTSEKESLNETHEPEYNSNLSKIISTISNGFDNDFRVIIENGLDKNIYTEAIQTNMTESEFITTSSEVPNVNLNNIQNEETSLAAPSSKDLPNNAISAGMISRSDIVKSELKQNPILINSKVSTDVPKNNDVGLPKLDSNSTFIEIISKISGDDQNNTTIYTESSIVLPSIREDSAIESITSLFVDSVQTEQTIADTRHGTTDAYFSSFRGTTPSTIIKEKQPLVNTTDPSINNILFNSIADINNTLPTIVTDKNETADSNITISFRNKVTTPSIKVNFTISSSTEMTSILSTIKEDDTNIIEIIQNIIPENTESTSESVSSVYNDTENITNVQESLAYDGKPVLTEKVLSTYSTSSISATDRTTEVSIPALPINLTPSSSVNKDSIAINTTSNESEKISILFNTEKPKGFLKNGIIMTEQSLATTLPITVTTTESPKSTITSDVTLTGLTNPAHIVFLPNQPSVVTNLQDDVTKATSEEMVVTQSLFYKLNTVQDSFPKINYDTFQSLSVKEGNVIDNVKVIKPSIEVNSLSTEKVLETINQLRENLGEVSLDRNPNSSSNYSSSSAFISNAVGVTKQNAIKPSFTLSVEAKSMKSDTIFNYTPTTTKYLSSAETNIAAKYDDYKTNNDPNENQIEAPTNAKKIPDTIEHISTRVATDANKNLTLASDIHVEIIEIRQETNITKSTQSSLDQPLTLENLDTTTIVPTLKKNVNPAENANPLIQTSPFIQAHTSKPVILTRPQVTEINIYLTKAYPPESNHAASQHETANTNTQMKKQNYVKLNTPDADFIILDIGKSIHTIVGGENSNKTHSGISANPKLSKKFNELSEKPEAQNKNVTNKNLVIQDSYKLNDSNKLGQEQNETFDRKETLDTAASRLPFNKEIPTLDSTIAKPPEQQEDALVRNFLSNIELAVVNSTRENAARNNTAVKPQSSINFPNKSSVLNSSTESNVKSEDIIINSNTTSSTARYTPPAKTTHEVRSLASHDQASNFVCKNRGRYSHETDCQKFYICIGKPQPIQGKCPNDTVFSEIRKQCTKNLSHCYRNNQFRCVLEGRFFDLLKDNIYYICVKNNVGTFIRFKLQCQSGYHLNKTSVRCVLNIESSQTISSNINTNKKNVQSVSTVRSQKIVESTEKSTSSDNSKNNSDQSSSSSKVEDVITSKPFECKKEGKFADAVDCRKYYICTKRNKSRYRIKSKKCDSDEIFHKDKKKCVDADSYECS